MKSSKHAEAKQLVFLKLGGSLITDKGSPRTPRLDTIDRIAEEISVALEENHSLHLLVGHGSGSFGHTSGKKYGTRDGVQTQEEWAGFTEVRHDAATLNQLVMNALRKVGLPAISFPPSGGIVAADREITAWDISPIEKALEKRLVPVVYGDVVFDSMLGGTILSTEDLFTHLGLILKPDRILLAGNDPGVWEDYPECNSLLGEITPDDLPALGESIGSSSDPDVTGGMEAKVKQMLELVAQVPTLEILIFSGRESGNIKLTLSGLSRGTILHI